MKPLTHDQNSTGGSGYTLIEVLMAMAIFSIGFLAVSTMQISAINSNANARNHTTVLTYAKDKVEDLMALPYTDANLNGSDGGTLHAPLAASDGIDNNENGEIDESGEAGHIDIRWRVWTIDLYGDPTADAKAVQVTVTRAATGKQRQAKLNFIKAPF